MKEILEEEVSARIERLLTAQPTAPPEARRVRRAVEVQRRWEDGACYVGLQLKVDCEFAHAYRRPGQYTTLKLEGWPARFYVITSRPRADIWEFLVDRSGELGKVVERLRAGDQIRVSLPEGTGFDPTEAEGKAALLFCTGSGVATMRPLVEEWLEGGEGAPDEIALYYGETNEEDFAFEELLGQWEEQGVGVHRAVESRSKEGGHFRYVQHAFEAAHPPVEDAYIYLSGAPVMIQKVAQKVLRLGVAPSRVKVNI